MKHIVYSLLFFLDGWRGGDGREGKGEEGRERKKLKGRWGVRCDGVGEEGVGGGFWFFRVRAIWIFFHDQKYIFWSNYRWARRWPGPLVGPMKNPNKGNINTNPENLSLQYMIPFVPWEEKRAAEPPHLASNYSLGICIYLVIVLDASGLFCYVLIQSDSVCVYGWLWIGLYRGP